MSASKVTAVLLVLATVQWTRGQQYPRSYNQRAPPSQEGKVNLEDVERDIYKQDDDKPDNIEYSQPPSANPFYSSSQLNQYRNNVQPSVGLYRNPSANPAIPNRSGPQPFPQPQVAANPGLHNSQAQQQFAVPLQYIAVPQTTFGAFDFGGTGGIPLNFLQGGLQGYQPIYLHQGPIGQIPFPQTALKSSTTSLKTVAGHQAANAGFAGQPLAAIYNPQPSPYYQNIYQNQYPSKSIYSSGIKSTTPSPAYKAGREDSFVPINTGGAQNYKLEYGPTHDIGFPSSSSFQKVRISA